MIDVLAMLADADVLLERADRAVEIAQENVRSMRLGTLTDDDVARAEEAKAIVDLVAEAFCREHFPRAGGVMVVLGGVYVLPRWTRSRGRLVAPGLLDRRTRAELVAW